MKKIFTLLAAVLMAAAISAQTPDKMSYQAVIRNTEGNLVTEKEVGMKITILQGAANGTVVYSETQTTESNKNGLVSIEIGGEAGFADIDWSDGPYFIKTETDTEGGTTISGTSQLLTVPYALHAKTAETISEPIVESDPVFEAHPASDIEATDISNWDEAYLWGDHADESYLETETDPVFAESVASDITAGDTTNWNEAYGWSDHSEAEYLTEEADPLFTASVASDITQEDIESWDAKSEFDGEFSSLTGVPNSVFMPAGVINIFAGGIAPDGYLICDGSEVSRTEYADLFAVIGTTYGEGDGATTFNLPNLQSRVPVGISDEESEFNELGKTGGAKEHVLTVDEMPTHDHSGTTLTAGAHSHSGTTLTAGAHTHSRRGGNVLGRGVGGLNTPGFEFEATNTAGAHTHTLSIDDGGAHTHTVTIDDIGGGIAHNNLQPYIVMNFIIKY